MPVHLAPADAAPAILVFWLDEVGENRWFAKDANLDQAITDRFGALRDAVVTSAGRAWRDTPDHLLAAIILIDQFGRNMFRGTAKAFAADPLARELTHLGLDRGWDAAMDVHQRQFLLMPLMHSESLADQQRALIEFEKLGNPNILDFARRHHAQIARFARFPGRNAALGRHTTPEEQEALDSGAAF